MEKRGLTSRLPRFLLVSIGLILLASLSAVFYPPRALSQERPSAATIHKAVLDAPVNAIQVEYISRALDAAERSGSALFLLEINTPGGLAGAMEDIISRMLVSRIPVCVYVYPPGGKAASAGFFILMSADIAAMAPGTRTGAAHPILSIGGVIPLDEPEKEKGKEGTEGGEKTRSQTSTLMEKVREDARAYLRAITERRGRNVEAADLAVTQSRSYSDQEALEQRLIDIVASNEAELLSKLDGRKVTLLDGSEKTLSLAGARIVEVEMTLRERMLEFLTDPNVAFLMAVVGALLIYVEITHAGMVIPGVVGALLMLLAVMGFSFLPINVTAVLLIIAALGLFIAEILVQGFGILGIAGAICLALGGIMLVDVDRAEVSVDPFLAIGVAVAFAAISIFLMGISVRVLRRRATTGLEGLIGLVGEAVTDLSPDGKVLLRGEYWNAQSGTFVRKGSKVRCIAAEGLVLKVEPVPSAEGTEGVGK